MPRFRDDFPRIKKEFHHGAWRLSWRWKNKKYSATTSVASEDAAGAIEAQARNLASQLASNTRPELTEPWRSTPGVIRYLDARYGAEADSAKPRDKSKWLEDYRREIVGKNSSGWVRDSIKLLENLRDAHRGLDRVDEEAASEYMAVRAAEKTRGTHNRNLTVFKKFYAWLVNTKRHATNPFAHIKRLNERKDAPIVYCTHAERDEAIILAMATGWPEWTAVPIAVLTGMRREEIANLKWEHLNFKSGAITVQKTKTITSRTIPMSTVLEEFLLEEPDQTGYVVKVPDGEDRLGRLASLAKRLKKDKKAGLTREWGIIKPPPSKAKEFRKKWNAYKNAMAEREHETTEAAKRLGWNVFRHTFASLKVQDGVSIEKVARWIGDDISTALRHYAQFVPKDRRDPDIDKG